MQGMELMRRFDENTRKLSVHRKQLELTEEMVHRMLGIPKGSRVVKLKRAESGLPPVEAGKKQKRRDSIVEELMSAVDDEDWKAKFLLLTYHYVLSPTSSNHGCVDTSSIFKEFVPEVKEMNWCKHVLEGLCQGVRDLKQKLAKIKRGMKATMWLKGCIVLLEIFYAEHIVCDIMKTCWTERTCLWLAKCIDDMVCNVYSKVLDFDNNSVEIMHYQAVEGTKNMCITNRQQIKGKMKEVCHFLNKWRC